MRSLQQIVEADLLVDCAKAYRCLVTVTTVAAGSRVNAPQRPYRSAREIFTRATAAVGLTLIHQNRERSVVGRTILALPDDITVPLESVSFERAQNQIDGALLLPRRIDVFNTKKPESVMDSGLQVAGNGRDKRAEVQRTGRRVSEPADVRFTGSDRPGRGIAVRRVPAVPGLRDTAWQRDVPPGASGRFPRRFHRRTHTSPRRYV